MWVLLLAGLIKLPIAALMLWIPFRYDESQVPRTAPDRGHRRCNVERRDRTGYVLFRS